MAVSEPNCIREVKPKGYSSLHSHHVIALPLVKAGHMTKAKVCTNGHDTGKLTRLEHNQNNLPHEGVRNILTSQNPIFQVVFPLWRNLPIFIPSNKHPVGLP